MKKNIIKTFTFMFSAMLLAKILGLIRNIVFANYYGTGYEATAFFTASRIPLQLLDITLGAAISSTFIPVFNEFLQKHDKKRAVEFANNFLNVIMIITVVIMALGMFFSPIIVNLIAPKLSEETFELTVTLTRILFPIMMFTAVAYVFVGFLQSLDEFNIPAIISVISNGILILYMVIFNDRFGIIGVSIAMAIGWFTQILIQLPSLKKKEFKYKFKIDFKDEGLKKVVKLALPILISSWVQPINNIVNIRLASGLENGQAVSAIEYAYTIYLIVVGVFSYTLSNIIFPELSKMTADKNNEKFKEIMKSSIKITVLFILPIALGIAYLSTDIIKVIYQRGEFTEVSTMITANALKFYAIGMIGYGLMEIINKAFYAKQDSKTPMKVSCFAIILNVLLSISLVKIIGYVGLPFAASITSILTALIMLIIMFKNMNCRVEKSMLIEILKYVISTCAIAIVLEIVRRYISGSLIKIAISILGSVGIYFSVLLLLKSEMMMYTVKLIKSKIVK